jgi:hypothetical protein
MISLYTREIQPRSVGSSNLSLQRDAAPVAVQDELEQSRFGTAPLSTALGVTDGGDSRCENGG